MERGKKKNKKQNRACARYCEALNSQRVRSYAIIKVKKKMKLKIFNFFFQRIGTKNSWNWRANVSEYV